VWASTARYAAKLLFIRAGERVSLHYHRAKDETLYVLAGEVILEHGPREPAGAPRADVRLRAGDSHHVPAGTLHRLIALDDAQVLEASTPEGTDVVRVDDRYGRIVR
jgi:quercetin dioxygenase-like cupin family protein